MFHGVISELRQPTRALRDAIPEAWAGFAALHEHALAPGTLHVKELVALAIAVSKECDGCIAYHARGAAMKGGADTS
jgi:AhpD family alkylhydroperoxidase